MININDITHIHYYLYITWPRAKPGAAHLPLIALLPRVALVQTAGTREATNGVSTNGVTAIFMFFDGGTFWLLLFTYFYLPKNARAYHFSQSVKI